MKSISLRTKLKMTSEERRQCILQAAKELFSRKGFLGVTTRQLAAAVGVTEPVLYGHFPSKRSLYDEVLLEESKTKMAEFRNALEPYVRARDDEGFCRTAAGILLERVSSDPASLRFLLQVLLEGGNSANLFYENQILPTHELIREYIEKRIEEGAFRQMNSKIATRQFLAFVIYHNSLQQLVDDRFMDDVPDTLVAESVRNFLRGIQQSG